MASRGVGTSGINNYDVNWFQSVINNLRASMVVNNTITASDINTLIYLWNVFNDHGHNVTDLFGIHDYGDGLGNPGYAGAGSGGSVEGDSLYGPSGISGDVGGVSNVDFITAWKHNDIRNTMAGGANHYHGWDDRSS